MCPIAYRCTKAYGEGKKRGRMAPTPIGWRAFGLSLRNILV
ncbi:hypothetical protein HMPREF1990_01962 [Porphyromonas gingivalis W4087]|nr:hypothetical protein HMPREF1990_01962 [Porphyromonas gingivalis W4087]